MAAAENEHEHSMAFATAALEKMRALRHAATPHNYEVWYNYACASNPALNEAINEMMAERGTITQIDVDRLYERFFSATRLTEKIEGFGSQIKGEIDQLITFIDTTLDSTARHSVSLANISSEIDGTTDLGSLRGVIGKLVQTARAIESANQIFEAHLKSRVRKSISFRSISTRCAVRFSPIR